MTLRKAIPEDAPPPYTPTDPLTPSSTNISVEDESPPESSPENVPSYSHSVQSSANFISAVPFFNERPPSVLHSPDEATSVHTLTIYARSQAKDYSRFPRCWRSRSEEVTQHDWLTFLNYLLPSHLGPASNHPDLPRKLRREIERDHKDRAQESDEQRRTRIAAVVDEWNRCFFGPRAMSVAYGFAPEAGTVAMSPLCPKCYPSTVRAMPLRHGHHPTLARSQTGPPVLQHSIPRKPVGGHTTNRTTGQSHRSGGDAGRDTVEPQSNVPQNAANPTSWGSWATTMQNWANTLSDQAQRYGEQVERQAMAHGRRIENNAESFGKMMEARGRALENYFEQQGERVEQAGERFENACSKRSPWLYPWNPSTTWRKGSGRGPDGGMGPQSDGPGCNYPASSRPRKASISSLSSSLSSSSSSSDSPSSLALDSDGNANAAGSKPEIDPLRQKRIQARDLYTDHRAKAAALRHEICALKAAHKELRSAASRSQDGGAGGAGITDAKAAEARAIKTEMWNLKREYKAMKKEFRQEKKQLRKAMKGSKKELKKARKGEKKQRKDKKKEPAATRSGRFDVVHMPVEYAPSIPSIPRQPTQPSSVPMPPPPPPPPPAAYSFPSIPNPPNIPIAPAAEVRAHTFPSNPSLSQEQEGPKSDSTKSTKGIGKGSSKDPASKAMGWGWTNSRAGSKSSGFRKKASESQAPSMQWTGDGKQQSGVVPVDRDEWEDYEEGEEDDSPPAQH
ncbi:hypothetical protein PRK78_001151 [Emydomyces testavorans]|uniref:Uncharacterized protein n=1 Tax=Emydomyces testavorans TaxID=2070801 RepID=A0AAF0DCF1_9EURO|nr:hypothetical protein PRK78_001151 [Emydomyces testavorans]